VGQIGNQSLRPTSTRPTNSPHLVVPTTNSPN